MGIKDWIKAVFLGGAFLALPVVPSFYTIYYSKIQDPDNSLNFFSADGLVSGGSLLFVAWVVLTGFLALKLTAERVDRDTKVDRLLEDLTKAAAEVPVLLNELRLAQLARGFNTFVAKWARDIFPGGEKILIASIDNTEGPCVKAFIHPVILVSEVEEDAKRLGIFRNVFDVELASLAESAVAERSPVQPGRVCNYLGTVKTSYTTVVTDAHAKKVAMVMLCSPKSTHTSFESTKLRDDLLNFTETVRPDILEYLAGSSGNSSAEIAQIESVA